ncbi:MAG TPA: (4Fe-4S)-binding protein [Bacteroidia bacterium]
MEKQITKKYIKDDLTIVWQPHKCIHSTVCWKEATGLPQVFDPRVKPWIQPENASKETIMMQIEKCPSGALSYILGETEQTQSKKDLEVQVSEDGPILIKGDLTIKYKGETLKTEQTTALCRCGASGKKPFCDGSHRTTGFKG